MRQVDSRDVNGNFLLGLYFLIKALPMLVSGMSVFLGYKLFILGVTGKASLSVETSTIGGQLLNAAPGLFFAIGGIVALIASVLKGVSIEFDGNRPRLSSNRMTPRRMDFEE